VVVSLAICVQAGAKGIPLVFLMTDNQIVKEQFLVFINDLLSTGIIQVGGAVSPSAQQLARH
jgi:hypothetical protein